MGIDHRQMKKKEVFEAIMDSLRGGFESFKQACDEARHGASDGESQAEGKYDTLSTETNYLADGQARQAEAVARAYSAFRAMGVRDFGPSDGIDVGALVETRMVGGTKWFFVGPASGGLEVSVDGADVTVITQDAPLGRQLIGLRTGDWTAAPKAEVISVR